jgi:hypothetical protein
MDRSDDRRIPLGALYGLLLAVFAWSTAFILPMTRDIIKIVFKPDAVVAPPFMAGWPDGRLEYVARDLNQRSVPPLQRGDRIVSIDGQPFRTSTEVSRRVEAAGPHGMLRMVVARKAGGADDEITSVVSLRSVKEGEGSFAIRVLMAVLGLLMPWSVSSSDSGLRSSAPAILCVARPLHAAGVSVRELAATVVRDVADALRVSGAIYIAVFGSTWPLTFPLFRRLRRGRLPEERRYGWIKWIVLAPVAAVAVAFLVVRSPRAWIFEA